MSDQTAAAEAPATDPVVSFDDYASSLGADEETPAGTFEDALNGTGDEPQEPAEGGEPAPKPKEQPAPAEGEQPRGADGKFVAKDATTTEEAPTTEPAAPAAPEFIRIELPEGHPLRERGRTSFEVRADSPEAEAEFRNLLNAPVRAREVESLRQETQRLQQAAAEAQARAQAQAEFNALVFADPRVIDTYRALTEEHGPEAAQTWLDGLLAKQGDQLQQHVQQALQQQQEVAYQRQATEFAQTVFEAAPQDFPGWNEADMRNAMAAYGSYVEAYGIDTLDPAAFRDFATPIYLNSATGRARVEAWQKQQAEAAAAETAKAEQEAAVKREKDDRERRAREENPLGALPAAAHTGHRVPAAAGKQPSFDDYLRGLNE